MTAIVKFKLSPRKAPSLLEGHTAEIILFPGVRYERHAEPAAATKPKRKRRSRAKQAQMVVVG